ncbi:MAG TPA: VOC family protein [Stellaceae bacterium]|jgi:PhnB protein|nr:VOC family protein [Stellaceae bacterium]
MAITTYLALGGRCEEAIAFYKKALGAEVQMMMRFKDHPEPKPPGMKPEMGDKIMHASVKIGDTMIMASDGMGEPDQGFHGFSLALSATDAADAERKFTALAEGGQVRMPLTKTFFSPAFGMVGDKFGINWMVMVEQH